MTNKTEKSYINVDLFSDDSYAEAIANELFNGNSKYIKLDGYEIEIMYESFELIFVIHINQHPDIKVFTYINKYKELKKYITFVDIAKIEPIVEKLKDLSINHIIEKSNKSFFYCKNDIVTPPPRCFAKEEKETK